MDAIVEQSCDSGIHESVAVQKPSAAELPGHDPHGVMSAGPGAGVAGMRGAVIADLQQLRLQGSLQPVAQGVEHRDGHGGDGASLRSARRASQKACTSTKTSVAAVSPITLKLTHARSERFRATRMFANPARA